MRSLSGRRLPAVLGRYKLVLALAAMALALAFVAIQLAPEGMTGGSSGSGGSAQQDAQASPLSEDQLQAEALNKKDIDPAEFGCWYPGVCFYLTSDAYRFDKKPWTVFVDITNTWQKLPKAKDEKTGKKVAAFPYAVINSRYDDGVKLHMLSGDVVCLRPGEPFVAYANSKDIRRDQRIDKLQIVNSSTCGGIKSANTSTADPAHGCRHPGVCFYLTPKHWDENTPTAVYLEPERLEDLSPSAEGSYAVFNARRGDTAIVWMRSGNWACVPTGKPYFAYADPKDPAKSERPDYVKIDESPKCPLVSDDPRLFS